MADATPTPSGDEDPADALRIARARFLSQFAERCDSIALLIDRVEQLGSSGPSRALRQMAHRMAGLAGMVGMPRVGEAARRLEEIVAAIPDRGFDRDGARRAARGLPHALEEDGAAPLPGWADVPGDGPARVLVLEHDRDHQQLIAAHLRGAGHHVLVCTDGADAVSTARIERPSLILLDVELPGAPRATLCRLLRADADLSAVPLLARLPTSVPRDEVGLALGPSDFLGVPIDPGELALRADVLLRRAKAPRGQSAPGVLGYEAFLLAARDELARTRGVIAIVRTAAAYLGATLDVLLRDVRRRDLVGRYDARHIVLCLADMTADAALRRLHGVANALERAGMPGMFAGVTATAAPGGAVEPLLAEADIALASGWSESRGIGMGRRAEDTAQSAGCTGASIVLAGRPEVVRDLDAPLRQAGYHPHPLDTGRLAATAANAGADLVVLDAGTHDRDDALGLRLAAAPRPLRVLCACRTGDARDVARAIAVEADDYVTLPVDATDLRARVVRLLR